jgi:K+-sensing histidine kinase KdpD
MEYKSQFIEARILIVDDEPSNVELLLRALSRAGYSNLNGITDSRQVLESLKEFQPDLLLLDLLMPHVDGFGVLETVAEIIPPTSHLPVLVLTADVTPETRRKALDRGATDFLTKPFDLSEVLLRIRNMLHIRQLHLQLRRHNRELEQRVRERTIELERALEAEREAAERLRELDEMKNSFLTAVSHELRTPMTSVLGGAVTLAQSGSMLSSEEQQDLIRGIVINAKRLNGLLADLLDVDRLARGILEPRRSPTDIRDLIDRIVGESAVPHDHPLDVQAEHAILDVDVPMVERMVQNLIANAARHTPAGTPIWVKTRAVEGGMLIAVEDAGPGVPEGLRKSIFEPFQQGDDRVERSPGVGIGLSLVLRGAELHGGNAWVEKRPGGGASFQIFLPAETAVVSR